MKKIVSVLLICTMLLGTIGVFASETQKETTEEPTVTNTVYGDDVLSDEDKAVLDQLDSEDKALSDEQVDEMTQKDLLEELNGEDEAVSQEVYGDEISKEKVVKILTATYKYMTQRDHYYKQVIAVLYKIEKIDNRALKKKAIVAFEKEYEKAKEQDQRVHQRIETVLKYIKNNLDEFTPLEKIALKKVYLPIVEKYNKSRIIVNHINKKILEIKKDGVNKELSALLKMADNYQKAGKLKTSAQLYQRALGYGVDKTTDTYKKAGRVLNQLEGKGPKIFVNGKRPDFDVKPFVKDGRTLVPLRKIAEALNATVQWDESNHTAIFTKGGKKVEIPIGSKKIRVNGQEKEIDVPAEVTNDRTVVPARVISETLDSTVNYDDETEVITIDDNYGTDDNQEADISIPELGTVNGNVQQSEDSVVNEITTTVK